MIISDKLLKPIIEAKYLNVENSDRYRTILRIFFINYERLKYWLYQEDIYQEMIQHEYFRDMEYTIEQCQQDLKALADWKNLVTIQDTRKVSSIEEFKNKKYRYQLSEYTVEIERLAIKLENLFIEGASLEPTLLERIKKSIIKAKSMIDKSCSEVYSWWNDLNNDFIRLNQNYQDYIRDLNGVKAEEMMKTKEFLVFKDKLIEYLRTFVKSLQSNTPVIEGYLTEIKNNELEILLSKIIEYELTIPRLDTEINEELLMDKHRGRFNSMIDWFVGENGQENEAAKLFDATNEIIRKITRYATQISELSSSEANRKEEYAKLASMFIGCKDIYEAHRLSAMVFGIDTSVHLKGEFSRDTDSSNSGVYEEIPEEVKIAPRVRTYREKSKRSPMIERTKEKEELLLKIIEEIETNKAIMESFIVNNKIDFGKLPIIDEKARETLLTWLSKALETADKKSRTEDGRNYTINMEQSKEQCIIQCTDGIFTMPHLIIEFENQEMSI